MYTDDSSSRCFAGELFAPDSDAFVPFFDFGCGMFDESLAAYSRSFSAPSGSGAVGEQPYQLGRAAPETHTLL